MSAFAPQQHALAGCRLRPFEQDDAAVLAQALSRLDPWAALGYGAAALAGYLGRDDPGLHRFVLAVETDEWAGVFALRSPWLRGPYVELLAVLPGHQGKGLGGVMVEWAAARAGDNLWACVSAFNADARRFYARHGFAEVAPKPWRA